jgi:hypothetical protein
LNCHRPRLNHRIASRLVGSRFRSVDLYPGCHGRFEAKFTCHKGQNQICPQTEFTMQKPEARKDQGPMMIPSGEAQFACSGWTMNWSRHLKISVTYKYHKHCTILFVNCGICPQKPDAFSSLQHATKEPCDHHGKPLNLHNSITDMNRTLGRLFQSIGCG